MFAISYATCISLLVPLELQPLEISRENISLGREIGQGEFGVVYEASAVAISKNIRVQTVAVKMLHQSKGADPSTFIQEAVRAIDVL